MKRLITICLVMLVSGLAFGHANGPGDDTHIENTGIIGSGNTGNDIFGEHAHHIINDSTVDSYNNEVGDVSIKNKNINSPTFNNNPEIYNSAEGGDAKSKAKARSDATATIEQNINYEDKMQGVPFWFQRFLQQVPKESPLWSDLPEDYLFLLERDYCRKEIERPLKKTGKLGAEWGCGFKVSVDVPNPSKKTNNIYLYLPDKISKEDMKKNHLGFVYLEANDGFGFSVALKYAKKVGMDNGARRAILARGKTKTVNKASSIGLYTTAATSNNGDVVTGGIGPAFAWSEQTGEASVMLILLKGKPTETSAKTVEEATTTEVTEATVEESKQVSKLDFEKAAEIAKTWLGSDPEA